MYRRRLLWLPLCQVHQLHDGHRVVWGPGRHCQLVKAWVDRLGEVQSKPYYAGNEARVREGQDPRAPAESNPRASVYPRAKAQHACVELVRVGHGVELARKMYR